VLTEEDEFHSLVSASGYLGDRQFG
jgi:hypothetical protein